MAAEKFECLYCHTPKTKRALNYLENFGWICKNEQFCEQTKARAAKRAELLAKRRRGQREAELKPGWNLNYQTSMLRHHRELVQRAYPTRSDGDE